jgi:hypothetical protein
MAIKRDAQGLGKRVLLVLPGKPYLAAAHMANKIVRFDKYGTQIIAQVLKDRNASLRTEEVPAAHFAEIPKALQPLYHLGVEERAIEAWTPRDEDRVSAAPRHRMPCQHEPVGFGSKNGFCKKCNVDMTQDEDWNWVPTAKGVEEPAVKLDPNGEIRHADSDADIVFGYLDAHVGELRRLFLEEDNDQAIVDFIAHTTGMTEDRCWTLFDKFVGDFNDGVGYFEAKGHEERWYRAPRIER